MTSLTITAREAFAFMVIEKGRWAPTERFNTFDDAYAELQRQAAANPGTTFIVARELLRAKGSEAL